MNQQEVTEMVGRHRDLIALRRALRLLQTRLINGGVANQSIDLTIQRRHSAPHTVQITKIHLDVLQTLAGNVESVSGSCSPLRRAVGSDHGPTLTHQRFHGVESNSGGGSSHQSCTRCAGHQAMSEGDSLP